MKKIIIFLIVLYGIISGFNVYALEDSFYEGSYIQGEYITKVKNGYKKYKQMREFKRSSDNRFTYCIELWEDLNPNKSLSGYELNKDNYSNISSSVLDKVILIAYYGYGYTNHTDIKWYVITQYMIWKEIEPDTDLYFTDTLNGNRITKYENEINEINNLINNHIKLPSFSETTQSLKYNTWLSLTDTNKVLDNFNLSSNNLEFIKEGNIVKVKTKSVGTNTLKLIKKDTKYSSYPIVYIDSSGQDLLVTGGYYPIVSTVNLILNSGSITVRKLDYDTSSTQNIGASKIDGTIFQLLDNENNVLSTAEVIDGKAIFNNIPYGVYNLKEIKPGIGYNINTELRDIHLTRSSMSIVHYNKVIKNKIIINKYLKDSILNNTSLEANAKFEVYYNDEKVKEVVTDNEGKAIFELPYGTYIVKQVSGSDNYKFTEDFIIDVVENDKTQEFNLYDEGYIFKLKIENIDYDSSKPILESGSSFIIKNIDTLEEIELETNEEGVTDTINLTTGNYEIIEKSVVDGYILNEEKVNININKDNYNEDDTIIIPITNKKKLSNIEFSKIIEYYFNDNLTDKEIDNSIEVKVYAKDDIYSKDGVKLYDKDEEVDDVTYNGSNILSKELVLGSYYVKDLDEKIVDINLDTTDTKKVSFLAKVYEYENNDDVRVIEVANTLSYKNIFEDFYTILILLGIVLINRGIRHE